jgi:NTE family protein
MQYGKPRGKPRVGLILSGGSARGIAHLGILDIFEAYHIPISFILAASYGAIVAGYYAYGYTPSEIFNMMKEFKLRYVLNLSKPWKGILSAEKTLSLFEKDVQGMKIESLSIPLSILAADIVSGEMVLIEEGSLSEAMLASSSFPGLYEPFESYNRLLTDGGILNRMLANVARSKGADIVIYCDVSIFTTLRRKTLPRYVYNVLLRHVEKNRQTLAKKRKRINIRYTIFKFLCILMDNRDEHEQFKKTPPDYYIDPYVGHIRPLQFNKVDELFEAGREAAIEVVQDICEDLNRFII